MAAAKKKASTRKSTTKRKTASKRTAAKSQNVTQPAATDSRPVKTLSKFELLRRFHLFSAVVGVLIAVASVFVLSQQTVNFTAIYSAKDPIASSGSTVLGTANESLFTVEVRYLVTAVFVIAALFALLLATKLRTRYEAGISNATSFIRWILMGVVVGLIVEIVTLLTGVQDIATLKLVVGLIVATTVLSYLAERDNKGIPSPKWGAYTLALFTGFLAWLPAIFALIGTHLYGLERYGWHVYALVALVLFGCIRFAITQYRFIKYPAQHRDYVLVEERYLSHQLFIKLGFAAILFVALID